MIRTRNLLMSYLFAVPAEGQSEWQHMLAVTDDLAVITLRHTFLTVLLVGGESLSPCALPIIIVRPVQVFGAQRFYGISIVTRAARVSFEIISPVE